MTDEDRRTIQTMLDGAVQSITAKHDRAFEALTAKQDHAVEALTAKQDRAVEALTANLADLRNELKQEIAALAERFATIESRTERMAVELSAILMQLAGINKSLSAAEQRESAATGDRAATRRTVDQLAAELATIRARLDALEKKAS